MEGDGEGEEQIDGKGALLKGVDKATTWLRVEERGQLCVPAHMHWEPSSNVWGAAQGPSVFTHAWINYSNSAWPLSCQYSHRPFHSSNTYLGGRHCSLGLCWVSLYFQVDDAHKAYAKISCIRISLASCRGSVLPRRISLPTSWLKAESHRMLHCISLNGETVWI